MERNLCAKLKIHVELTEISNMQHHMPCLSSWYSFASTISHLHGACRIYRCRLRLGIVIVDLQPE